MLRSIISPPGGYIRWATGVALFSAVAGCGGKAAAPGSVSDAGPSDSRQDRDQIDLQFDGGPSESRPVQQPALVESRRFPILANREVDIIFTIDDSPSMAPLQAKMAAAIPDFINVLNGRADGLPSLNVAIVSSSLGAGNYGNVPGCQPNTIGNLDGAFQHPATCTQLPADQKFISSKIDPNGARVNNFNGDIAAALACMVQPGQNGCEFEHQFESTRLALQRAKSSQDSDNAGFLRPNADLAVVMLTNEDDCSVPSTSTLFDPSKQTLADPLGGLQSYRCNEFGHLCDGMRPPHTPPAASQALNNCVSAEDGVLVTTDGFTQFLMGLKPDPRMVLVAAIAGPATPYVVESRSFPIAGGSEIQPVVGHACTQSATEYGDPGVRIKQWIGAFGARGVFQSICANDFRPAMVAIAAAIARLLGDRCVDGTVLKRPDGTPDCAVVERTFIANGLFVDDTSVSFCDGVKSVVPCWTFAPGAAYCPKGQLLRICHDATCDPAKLPTAQTDLLVSCAIAATPI